MVYYSVPARISKGQGADPEKGQGADPFQIHLKLKQVIK
jgi:hypothetical protein